MIISTIRRISLLLLLGAAFTGLSTPARVEAAPKDKKKKKDNTPPPPAPAPANQQNQPAPEIEITPDQTPPAQPGGQPQPEIEITPDQTPGTPPVEDTTKPDKDLVLGEHEVSWTDIVVVVRKPFLKASRIELIPSWGLTLNDNMIRHIMFQGQVNYWLTDVLAVGAEAQLFAHTFLEPYDLVARDYRRLPTLNQYNFGGALNFHYVPMYGKFAIVNKYIVHWEGMFTAGVGFTQSEVIPRDPANQGWTNFLITPNIGVTFRVFLSQWLTLDLAVKDYIFIDQFENVNRTTAMSLDEAKANASSQLINNIMFTAGVSFWIPPVFHYTTFR